MGRGAPVPILLLFGMTAIASAGSACAQAPFDEIGGAFATPVSFAVGQQPYAAAIGNLDADALPELVVGNEGSDNVAILQGDASGGFGSATFVGAGDGAQGVALADVDGDGDSDLVVANLWASTLTVRRGDGTGGFAVAQTLGSGANPHAVIAADLDGDGDLDLASANGGGGVSVYVNSGGGNFAAAVNYSAGINPRDIAAEDFDGDGDLDLVVTNEGGASVSIFAGAGNGTFGAHQEIPVGAQPQSVSVGDINLDGDPDLAVPSAGSATIALLLGGSGTGFSAGTAVATSGAPSSARLVDVDGDGPLDLVTAGHDRVFVHRGNNAGNFAAGASYLAAAGARAPLLANLDADGKADLLVVASAANAVVVLRNVSEPQLNIAPSPMAHARTSYESRKVEIWVNRQTSGTWPAAFPFSHAGYLDVDRDGDTDFMRTFSDNANAFPVQVMRNDGGVFTDATGSAIVGPHPDLRVPRKIISGDFNGDGWPDVFVAATGIDTPPFPGEPSRLFLSNGNGTLTAVDLPQLLIGFNHCATAADIDANGTIDLLVGRAGSAYLLLNDGQAGFETSVARLPTNTSFFTCEFADLDQDGWVDLVVGGHEQDGNVTRVYWGQASGLYRASNSVVVPAIADYGVVLDFAFEDFNGDGARDLIALRTGSTNFYQGRYLQVLRRLSRSLVDETAQRITMNRSLPTFDFLRAQDFDGDNDVDLFIDDRNDIASGEWAWRNSGGTFTPYFGAINPSAGAIFASGFENP